MSRYVWQRSSISAPSINWESEVSSVYMGTPQDGSGFSSGQSVYVKQNNDGSIDERLFQEVSGKINTGSPLSGVPVLDYPYYMNGPLLCRANATGVSDAKTWRSNSSGTLRCYSTATGAEVKFLKAATRYVKDCTAGLNRVNKSTSNPSAYSSGARPDGYFYTYIGSDDVEPRSVSYLNEDVRPGDTITAVLEPGTNTYGGTIYYQYQYSTGGSWINVGSKTTDTAKEIAIPDSAEAFQVRVSTTDDMGYVSSGYVYGETLSIFSGRWYFPKNNTIERVEKAYIVLSKTPRELKKLYIVENGNIHPFYNG